MGAPATGRLATVLAQGEARQASWERPGAASAVAGVQAPCQGPAAYTPTHFACVKSPLALMGACGSGQCSAWCSARRGQQCHCQASASAQQVAHRQVRSDTAVHSSSSQAWGWSQRTCSQQDSMEQGVPAVPWPARVQAGPQAPWALWAPCWGLQGVAGVPWGVPSSLLEAGVVPGAPSCLAQHAQISENFDGCVLMCMRQRCWGLQMPLLGRLRASSL